MRGTNISPFVITVGATTCGDKLAYYSNTGSNIFITAPGGAKPYSGASDACSMGMLTASALMSGDNAEMVCKDMGAGTSYSTPLVAGASASILSANPSLTWRDVKYILANTARIVDKTHPTWNTNGAGRMFSNWYGFGVLDVGSAVVLASTWTNVAPLKMDARQVDNVYVPLTLGATSNSSTSVNGSALAMIETVNVAVSMKIMNRGSVSISVVSPSGTESVLLPTRNDQESDLVNWDMLTNAFWGETKVNGVWMLKVVVPTSAPVKFSSGVLTGWSMKIRGV